jgi:uncharacterized protein YhjY with autotransporter beta-barrel domain
LKRSSLICGVSSIALLAGMAESALADDLSVGNSTAITTPLETAKASNGTPGNITTLLGSVVRIDSPGATLTLNSNNKIDLSGLIENTAASGGIGVHIVGGFAGNFTAQGGTGAIINVTGSGTGSYGLLLDGTSPFVGNITFQPGSSLIVYGENAVGVAIDAPLTGNLITGAAIQGTGVGATGVRITGPITGSYINNGALSVRGTNVFTVENVDPISGSGIAIGASISQGFLNAGPVSASDGSTSTGRVTNSSTAPSVLIAPSVAGANAASITLGAFAADTAGLNFSFLNRGNITASENDVGISTTGMRLGETGDTVFTTLLSNGFYNRGSIVSSSQSDNSVSTSATAVPTNATGLVIGNGATINSFGTSETAGYSWLTTAITGSTATTLTLGADASTIDGVYDGLTIELNGETRTITNYDVTLDANGAVLSRIATLNAALPAAPLADTKLTIKGDGWPTKAATGSTATTIALGADASTVDGIYDGFQINVGGELRTITSYDVVLDAEGKVVSKTATLDTALTAAPAAGAGVTIKVPATTAVALTTSASDISGVYNGFTISSGGDTRTIGSYVVIYDPATNQPVMRVAKIEGLTGGSSPWGTAPVNGASVSLTTSALFNAGAITAAMGGNKGGVVTALMIQSGGVLPSLTNYGTIAATARTTDTTISGLNAVAINDQSGTLNTIFNHGTISASATRLDGGTQVSVAADLSHSSSAQRFYVLSGGDVVGDILFGSAPVDASLVAQNRLIIEGNVTRTIGDVTTVDNSTVFGSVRATGDTGSLDIEVSRLETGGVLRTSNTRATSLFVGSKGAVGFALDQNTGSAPLIETTGSVTFKGNSEISVTPTSFLPANGTYKLITAGAAGTVHFDNFAASAKLNSGSPFPFLLEGTFTADGQPLNAASVDVIAKSLDLQLRRKTATELGLIGNAASIYEPLAAAALGDDEFGAALLTLDSAAEVQSAIATTVPDLAGGMRALTVAMTDQATGVIGARQRSLLTAPEGTRNEFRFWGQEFYNIVSFNGTQDHTGYGGAGQGVAVGVEWGALETGRFGVGYTFFSSQETERHPRETKTNGDWNMLSAYGAWRFNNLFVAPQVNVGLADFKTRRAIQVGQVVGRLASAKQTNYLASGGATAGYVIEFGNIDIIPTIAVDMMYLNQGSYEEFGGGGMNLQLQSSNQTSVRSFAGVIGQGSYTFNEGAFMPQLLAGWTHEFANDPITIDGSFESSPGSPFHLVGPALDANKVVGGMSLGYVMRNWSAGFNYDAAASQGSLAQSATFSISSRF